MAAPTINNLLTDSAVNQMLIKDKTHNNWTVQVLSTKRSKSRDSPGPIRTTISDGKNVGLAYIADKCVALKAIKKYSIISIKEYTNATLADKNVLLIRNAIIVHRDMQIRIGNPRMSQHFDRVPTNVCFIYI